MKKIVVIPTFNEKENISDIIKAVMDLQQNFHILVVDDSSPDGTARIVEDLIPMYKGQLFLSVRQVKDGLGKAYIHGFKWALEHGYDYIFEMDADFSHNPNDLPKLYEACQNAGHDEVLLLLCFEYVPFVLGIPFTTQQLDLYVSPEKFWKKYSGRKLS
ncbi:hypothetical protein FQR65_LT19886 [Abscondita terminalis]|nr:hypothetical protein FQR65_LT19886 [Abscondita terminalis]